VPAGERRCLILQVFLYFGMKRFSDVSDVKVKDVKYLHSGDLEVFVKSSKTDQERRGSNFVMSGKSKGGICIPEMVTWYRKSLNLSDEDFLFPRLRGNKNGAVGSKAVAYSTTLADLKEVTRRLGICPASCCTAAGSVERPRVLRQALTGTRSGSAGGGAALP
jgi:hypothetical protein